MSWREHLQEIYFDVKNPISYAGPTKIYRYLRKEGKYKVGLSLIKQWLQDIDAYSLQRPQRYKFKRNRVISQGIDYLWDVDLADVSNLSKENDGIKYLFVVIDVFSRYLWVQPLLSKQHGPVIEALNKVLSSGRHPKEIRTDKGSEFKNKWLAEFFKTRGIHHYVTQNETKANYAERVIRTLKVLFYRYFTHNRTHKYMGVLQDIVRNYNNRSHRSLNGLSPSEVNPENEAILWKEMYIDVLNKSKIRRNKKKIYKRFKFKRGDYVRLSSLKRTFQRDYEQKWSEEVFIITRRFLRQGIPVYKVSDYDEDPIEGTFYESELQKVNKTRNDLWKIEKVLKTRRRRGIKEVYVKWSTTTTTTTTTPPPPPPPQGPPPPPPQGLPPPPPPPPQGLPPPGLSTSSQAGSFKFGHPFTMLVAGPTMSGKSTFVKDLLIYNDVMIQPNPSKIIWIYKRWQPLYDVISKYVSPPVQFIQGLTDEIRRDDFINSRENNLIILDDIQRDATGSQDICELFTEGAHHRNLSVICIMQNIFNKGKENRTINLNTQYLVLFKNPRDQLQISTLARQMYPGRTKKFMDMYRQATDKSFGYLVIDLKQATPDSKRLQTDIFRDYIKDDDSDQAHSFSDSSGVQTSQDFREDFIYFPDTEKFNNYKMSDNARQIPYHMDTFHHRRRYEDSDNLIPAHLDNYNQRRRYEEKNEHPTCSDCGIMFGTTYDLQRHIKNGCPMNEDDDSNDKDIDMDYDEQEDNDEGYDFLVNDVWDEHSEQYDRKINKLLEDDEEMSKDDAMEEASELMLSKDRSLFMKKYKDFFLYVHGLNESKLHRDIKREISDLVNDQKMDVERACDFVIKQHKTDFDKLFDDYHRSDDDDDTDDEEESA
ncbi:hypothetical protein FSP39_004278 [Pinctada imbricata]|uniref:Integrase catalytic domain-containing protein n=1 Tax=Pinctada imbricata TaxID=66713 RepID=A0AA88YM89_PINIB|nr:hypothetical protein FSP39_004278 [Pinctada imbricata]